MDNFMDSRMIDKIMKALPSGSGIDYEWYWTEYKNGNVDFHNKYHGMNSDGYYNRIIPFTVKVFTHKTDKLNKLKGPLEGKVQVINRKGDLDFKVFIDNSYMDREYIEETVGYSLESLEIGTIRHDTINA